MRETPVGGHPNKGPAEGPQEESDLASSSPPQYQVGFSAEERPALPAPRPQRVSAWPGLESLRWGVAGRNVVSWGKMSRGSRLGRDGSNAFELMPTLQHESDGSPVKQWVLCGSGF